MAAYKIEVTEDAKLDMDFYSAAERKAIVSGIRSQLTHDPTVETRNRKMLRDNPIATWELRIGKHRVFYEVDGMTVIVTIVSVGHKDHNKLFIRGKEVSI
ncbi:MAG: type II toxin-antitoxin system RelE family toxin [Blastocatellia bacterium]